MIKTVSLETAKTLNRAGFVKDNVAFAYCMVVMNTSDEGSMVLLPTSPELEVKGIPELATTHYYDAPNTDELLEELPDEYDNGSIAMTKNSVYYEIYEPYEPAYVKHCFEGESLPEAIAKMWLYLTEQGLIKPNPKGDKCE